MGASRRLARGRRGGEGEHADLWPRGGSRAGGAPCCSRRQLDGSVLSERRRRPCCGQGNGTLPAISTTPQCPSSWSRRRRWGTGLRATHGRPEAPTPTAGEDFQDGRSGLDGITGGALPAGGAGVAAVAGGVGVVLVASAACSSSWRCAHAGRRRRLRGGSANGEPRSLFLTDGNQRNFVRQGNFRRFSRLKAGQPKGALRPPTLLLLLGAFVALLRPTTGIRVVRGAPSVPVAVAAGL